MRDGYGQAGKPTLSTGCLIQTNDVPRRGSARGVRAQGVGPEGAASAAHTHSACFGWVIDCQGGIRHDVQRVDAAAHGGAKWRLSQCWWSAELPLPGRQGGYRRLARALKWQAGNGFGHGEPTLAIAT